MPKLKTAYEKSRVIKPLYTGGPVAVTSDALHIVTCVGEEAVLTRLEDGEELKRFIADTETIYSLCLTPSSSHLIVFTASLALHIYDNPLEHSSAYQTVRPSKTVARAHDAPTHVCGTDQSSSLLASGSADGVVKVWDIHRGYVTHVFKGHGGVVSALRFYTSYDPSAVTSLGQSIYLISGSVDTRLRVFDLSSPTSLSGSGRPLLVLEGHMSVPRGLDISSDGRWLISGGRDSVVMLWDLKPNDTTPLSQRRKEKGKGRLSPVLTKTIPIFERVEAVGFVSVKDDDLLFFTAGEKGILNVWNARNGTVEYSLGVSEDEGDKLEEREILDARFIPSNNSVFSVHADQNILFYSLSSRTLTRQLVGFNDEIISATFVSTSTPDSVLAIAANSSLIRVYSTIDNDARLLAGHSDVVLCLSHSADKSVLASGSKDKTARIWTFSSLSQSWICIGICEGHAESIGGIVMSRKECKLESDVMGLRFMFTGSQDRTIKMWDLSSLDPQRQEPTRCKSLTTHKAHEKDINSLDVAPNDRFLASGSQDKTAKVYEITYTDNSSGPPRGEIKLLGTCKGHKRGVWAVKFANQERLLATAGGDKTIKLWNLDDFSCIKTFEGHTNSILQIAFINQDMQLVSSASDGLVKIWNVRNEECITTLDNHEDKVWALAISSDESRIVSGAADSVITIWADCTEQKEQEKNDNREKVVLEEQDLQNYILIGDYRRAISLALAMNQPGRLHSLFRTIITAGAKTVDNKSINDITRHPEISVVIQDLPQVELVALLCHIRDWNASAKTSLVAQSVLNAVLKLRTIEDITEAFKLTGSHSTKINLISSPNQAITLNDLTESLIPYTERHLNRLSRLVQDTYIVDFIVSEMNDRFFADDEMNVDF